LEIGDLVEWESQSAGVSRIKSGHIVEVLEVGRRPTISNKKTFGLSRDHRIGDKVKILKKTYSNTFESFPGVIVGFEAFKQRPCIVVCYLVATYDKCTLHFSYINKDTEDIELVPMLKEEADLDKGEILEMMNVEIQKKQMEVDELVRRRDYVISHFEKYFEGSNG